MFFFSSSHFLCSVDGCLLCHCCKHLFCLFTQTGQKLRIDSDADQIVKIEKKSDGCKSHVSSWFVKFFLWLFCHLLVLYIELSVVKVAELYTISTMPLQLHNSNISYALLFAKSPVKVAHQDK